MASFQSSQNFIRSLKASSDPPSPGGPHKIDIARQAWDDDSFYLPSKAEVIAEWILSTLFKERSQLTPTSSILSAQYWKLLLDILSAKKSPNARPLKTWLLPLLHRTSIQPILSSILETDRALIDSYENFIAHVSSCISIMWPISVQKMSLENLADLFGLLLRKASKGDLAPEIAEVGILAVSSYRTSLGNSTNKKKFYQLFLQTYLSDWLCALSPNLSSSIGSSPAYARLLQSTYEAGTDTLFSLDALRQLVANRATDQPIVLFERFRALGSSALVVSSTVLFMPRLLLSYVQALKRYRGAVFNQGSGAGVAALTDETNAASMKFFADCEAMLSEWGDGGTVSEGDIWKARLGLLETVLDEKIFGVHQTDAVAVLNKVTQSVITALSNSWGGGDKDTISLAVRCVHKIGQIDCDLLLPSLPHILPSLLPVSMAESAPASLLDLILDYHTKTRSLNTHLTNLLSSFAPTSFPSPQNLSYREVYELCFSGHILGSQHLEKLGSAIRSFLTPGQTPHAVESLVESLKSSWKMFFDAAETKLSSDDGGSPKKQKKGKAVVNEDAMEVDEVSELSGYGVESLAVSFSLRAQLALVVFPNLPVQNLTGDSVDTVKGIIVDFSKNLVRRAFKQILATKRLLPGDEKGKHRREPADPSGWAVQIAAAAMLRVNYVLCTARNLTMEHESDVIEIVERAGGIIAREGGKGKLAPELELEIFRTSLFHIEAHQAQSTEVAEILDNVLSYLTGSFKPSDCSWSGLSCHLKSPESGALALFHLILERWLPLIDNLSSPSQLTKIIRLILSIDLSGNSATLNVGYRPEHLLLQVLRSAEFWEMHNLQSALISHLAENIGAPNTPVEKSELAVYHLLLYVPAEYHNRTTRSLFTKRAFGVDVQLVHGFHGRANEQEASLQELAVLRTFLKRTIGLAGFECPSGMDLGDFIIHLMSFDHSSEDQEYQVFVQVTLDLAELCLSELVKDSASNSNALFKIIRSLSQLSNLVETRHEPRNLRFKLMTCLLDAITRLKASSLPSQPMTALHDLHADLSSILSAKLRDVQQTPIIDYSEAMVGWCCTLRLRSWLGESSPGEGDEFFGRLLVPAIIREHGDEARLDDVCESIFAILRAELSLASDPVVKQQQLALIIAAFISLHNTSGTATRKKVDKHLSSISQSLTPADYLYALDLLSDWLSSKPSSVRARETAIHLSILLLLDHPQNTLKYVQAFTTRCLDTFVSCEAFAHDTIKIRLLTLEFMVQYCSEMPAALRPVDLGSIWIILFKFLEPSEEHDELTTLGVFHKIVATISALVRLRRDLLTSVLPHLSLILRQLLSLIRSCRPQLGTKQTSMVMRTLPRWVNVKQPLGGEEGRMLSRLLETLNAKTVIRSHTASDIQKAESLAKPFSKHAAYVLAAYIEALNDPLCIVTQRMRQELEPGLLPLCGLMGEHARDALVVGLDVNGKALLKLIWKEYEKQRYVGQG